MPTELAQQSCAACKGDVPALTGDALKAYAAQVPLWTVVAEHHLERSIKFPDFATALAYVNRIGALAEAEGHHPDLGLSWGQVDVKIYTHKVKGLTLSDFILAAKIDTLPGH